MQESSNTVEIELDPENPNFKEILKLLDYDDDGLSVYVEVDVHFEYHYDRGRRYGIPENCYPSEFEYYLGAVIESWDQIDLTKLLNEKDLINAENASIRKLEDNLY